MKKVLTFLLRDLSLISLIFNINLSKSYEFYNLARISKHSRQPKSKIIQFFCGSRENIGDYLPVLGIRQMLNQTPDLWHADHKIDYNFVNKNYKCGIIGGAGLLHPHFEKFWKELAKNCKIPLIVWGIGICLPKYGKQAMGVNKDIARIIFNKCDLINFRDTLTAQYYNVKKCSITPCPCIAYLQKFRKYCKPKNVLYSCHPGLTDRLDKSINSKIIKQIKSNTKKFSYTNNFFKSFNDFDNIIKNYCNSKIVVSTRLHGAIIPYALGIPYIVIPYDKKVSAFYNDFGNGLVVKSPEELDKALDYKFKLKPIKLKEVLEFGKLAKNWIDKKVRV